MLDTVPLQSRLLDHADHYARWSGLAIGIVAAQQLVMMESGDITIPLVFAITAFGLCAVVGVLLGDALTLRPQEAVRTASLAPRLVRNHVPPRMAPLLLLQAASLVALLVMGAVTASSGPDRAGGAGRVINVACQGMGASLGPWPGLYYSGPMFAALAVGTPPASGPCAVSPTGRATTSSAATARGRSREPGGCWCRVRSCSSS